MSRQARRQGYDWTACVVAILVGLIVAVPAGLLATRVSGSTLLLTAVVTLVGTGVSRWTYSKLAKPGSRPITDEDCGPQPSRGRGDGGRTSEDAS